MPLQFWKRTHWLIERCRFRFHLKLSRKKFSCRTSIAVYFHNQKDNCETLNASDSLIPPPPGFDIVGYLYQVVRQMDEERGQLLCVQSLYRVHDSNGSSFFTESKRKQYLVRTEFLHVCACNSTVCQPPNYWPTTNLVGSHLERCVVHNVALMTGTFFDLLDKLKGIPSRY